MFKALCITALLVATLSFVGHKTADASASDLSSPVIVARGKLPHRTAEIPTTTIFTPPQSGLYRISVYITVSTPVTTQVGTWEYSLNWTDDAGAEQAHNAITAPGNLTPPSAYGDGYVVSSGNVAPGIILTFQSVAGSPISYELTDGGNSPDGSVYSLYWVLERLE